MQSKFCKLHYEDNLGAGRAQSMILKNRSEKLFRNFSMSFSVLVEHTNDRRLFGQHGLWITTVC